MLLTDNGAWSASRADLTHVPVPAGTSSYTPVPHETFLQAIHVQLPAFRLTCETEQLALARDGKQMFGVLSCTNGTEERGLRLAIGFRNSYDKSLSCGLVAGLRVVVCSNLCFSGEVEMRRRHTLNVLRDLPDFERILRRRIMTLPGIGEVESNVLLSEEKAGPPPI